MVSNASDDFPDPDSPVITTSLSRGISTSMFLRLCSRAPLILMPWVFFMLPARIREEARHGRWDARPERISTAYTLSRVTSGKRVKLDGRCRVTMMTRVADPVAAVPAIAVVLGLLRLARLARPGARASQT